MTLCLHLLSIVSSGSLTVALSTLALTVFADHYILLDEGMTLVAVASVIYVVLASHHIFLLRNHP